ncbi:cysteine desulfhydrase [Enterococcus florum]|uniref:cysteine-S-conjugate beta-lyase n=1 Tax=Enterococcus florum TaxID=2480627 RepID=A0A4P5PEP0_9ENTE|nr:MalY/PatB family protein [Enterococcus florum]GCF94801.1 cysteine desulfhydrase [Enterococcus florum]
MVDFNKVINRKGTNSVKWDEILETYQEDDLLPLWVADMDFKAPAAVLKAFHHSADLGIFGYQATPDSLYTAIIEWHRSQHQLELNKDEIIFFSGVLAGLTTALQAFTQKDEAVLIHDPVYPPFSSIVENNQRKLVRSPLKKVGNNYQMDLADMEEKIKQHQVKVMILCNPHNPGGRVWTKKELEALGKLCQKYQVIVFSDEIHQDLVFQPNRMTNFLSVDKDFSAFTIQFTSMTKTFNLAGIKNSLVFVKDPSLRETLQQKQEENFQQEINTFGLLGMEAAYTHGHEWLEELLQYLKENIDFTLNFFADELPKAKIMEPEGTYLLWIDFSAYGFSDEELMELLVHKGKVLLNAGISYGPAGKQHMRLNAACPRDTLQEGLSRIVQALS